MATGAITTFNGTLGASATLIASGNSSPRSFTYMRIWNVSASATVWCTRAGVNPGANTGGSFPILAGSYEEFKAPAIPPPNDTWALGNGAQLTVEIF